MSSFSLPRRPAFVREIIGARPTGARAEGTASRAENPKGKGERRSRQRPAGRPSRGGIGSEGIWARPHLNAPGRHSRRRDSRGHRPPPNPPPPESLRVLRVKTVASGNRVGEPTRRGRAVRVPFSHGEHGDHGGSLELGSLELGSLKAGNLEAAVPRCQPADGISIRSRPGTEGPRCRRNGSAHAMSATETRARPAFLRALRVLRARNRPLAARRSRGNARSREPTRFTEELKAEPRRASAAARLARTTSRSATSSTAPRRDRPRASRRVPQPETRPRADRGGAIASDLSPTIGTRSPASRRHAPPGATAHARVFDTRSTCSRYCWMFSRGFTCCASRRSLIPSGYFPCPTRSWAWRTLASASYFSICWARS